MAQIDPREVEVVEVGAGGRPIGLDLIALEGTRFGLEVLGIGYVLLLCGMGIGFAYPTAGTGALGVVVGLLHAAGFAGLLVAALSMAPTPNGPLPGRLRPVVVLVFAAGLAWALLTSVAQPTAARLAEGRPASLALLALRAAPLALAWILWRFCQHRGLIGRALTWLWTALLWSTVFLALEWRDVYWTSRLFPAIGVAALFSAHYAARDIWVDAVNRKTKRLVLARPAD